MKAQTVRTGIVLGLFGLLAVQGAGAQITKEQLDAVGARLQAARAFYDKLPPQQQKMLSGSAVNFFHLAEVWPELRNRALQIQEGARTRQISTQSASQLALASVPLTTSPVGVSNPAVDFKYGPSGGFTQNETSTAWCGSHVVVAFNDSGSGFENGFATNFVSQSFNGFALSTTTGTAYTDEGYLPANFAGSSSNFLAGDPVIACSSASSFYYSSLFELTSPTNLPLTAVSLSLSTTGGSSFGNPIVTVSKNGNSHMLDKDWMAVNPANPNQIAVTYTDFDTSGLVCGANRERIAIELVYSKNGGTTWSSPVVIDQQCYVSPNFPWDQGSQLAFSPSGAVNVAFEQFSQALPAGRAILFRQAPSLGSAFGSEVKVADVTGVGDGKLLQGGFRAFIDLQGMAVDRSAHPTNGNIYLVWHDTDSSDSFHNFSGVVYDYSDVWISKSTNNGLTWSTPVHVNNNSEPLAGGLGTDSFMPGIAVDGTSGKVAVCWYDRRNDPLNLRVDRYCGGSTDAGGTFTNARVTPANFLPIHGMDDLVSPDYMGDYDGLASDGLKATSGFIGAFQKVSNAGGTVLVPNSDVWAFNFD